jgi:hypothetical protein
MKFFFSKLLNVYNIFVGVFNLLIMNCIMSLTSYCGLYNVVECWLWISGASEAAAAAELIATAVVEDILANPQGLQVVPPPTRTDPLALVVTPANTFTTPAITMPSVVPNAPAVEQRPLLSFSGG